MRTNGRGADSLLVAIMRPADQGYAQSAGYSRYWIGRIAKHTNADGLEDMRPGQYTPSHRAMPLLSPEQVVVMARAGARATFDGKAAGLSAVGADVPVPWLESDAEFTCGPDIDLCRGRRCGQRLQ